MNKLQIFRKISQKIFAVILTGTIITIPHRYIIIIVSSMIFGSFFCGWACPFGFLQDLLGKIGLLFKKEKYKLPENIQKHLNKTRYFLFAVLTIESFKIFYSKTGLNFYSTFFSIINKNFTILSIIFFTFFVIIPMFFDRPYCNFLCTGGAKFGLASYFRIFTIKRNKDLCSNCKTCSKVCPMNIKVNEVEEVRDPHCINCFNCISNCPKKGTLKYKI